MNEVEQIKENQADRGGCYPRPRRITPSEICLILHILRKPNSLIGLSYSFKIMPSLKTSQNMLTFVDVKFVSIVDVQKVKGYLGLQISEIYSKQQMSVELYSCYVFRQQFVVKQVKCSTDCSVTFLQIFQSNGEGEGGGGKGGLLTVLKWGG